MLTCLAVLVCYYYGSGDGDGGDGGGGYDGDCAVPANFYGRWLNEELKIVLADWDIQQDGILCIFMR